MKIFKSLTKSLFFLSILISFGFSTKAQSADEGKTLFNANCTACHAINDKIVGPALKDVHKRREESWLIKWVKNSQAMVKSGDATAVQLYKENNESVMTSFESLSDVQIKSIVAYIKAESEAPAAAPATASVASSESNTMETSNNDYKSEINWLLLIIAVLLIAIVIRIMGILNKIGEIQGKPVINWTKTNGLLVMAFMIIGLVATFWEFYVHGKLTVFAMGAASAHGDEYDNMFMITLGLTGVVFVITQILLFWYAYKYKNDGKRKAMYFPDNHKLEFIWTIVPAVVLTVLVIRGLMTWNNIMYSKEENAREIEVFGYQFAWDARLAGADNKLGAHNFREIGKVNALGVDTTDEKAKDDIVVKELHLEVGKPVNFHFRSKDVIHSAYFPHFRAQMNVVPGLPTKFSFTPIVTTADMRNKLGKPEFDYVLLCNKICGSAHYRMKMVVVVDSKEAYEKWLASQKTITNQPVNKSIASK